MLLRECKTAKDRQRFAIEYHGIECQQRKLVEEVHELNEAITKYETRREAGIDADVTEIITEIADVKNLIEQFQSKYMISNVEVNVEKTRKIDRHFTEMKQEIENKRGDLDA